MKRSTEEGNIPDKVQLMAGAVAIETKRFF
jgi:hypothetical protein